MKLHRICVIESIPADEFYGKNATDLDFYFNGDYKLMERDKDSNNHFEEQSKREYDLLDNEDLNNLPF